MRGIGALGRRLGGNGDDHFETLASAATQSGPGGDYSLGTKLWHANGDSSGRYALEGKIDLGGGIVYRNIIAELGIPLPVVGRRRVIRYLGPQHMSPSSVEVHFPGFAHTSLSYDPDWMVRYMRREAKKHNRAFITINPAGRAVQGYDHSPHVGKISLEETIEDDDHVLRKVLAEVLKTPSAALPDLVIRGHSLGARLAREAVARILADEESYRGKVEGVVLEAPAGAMTGAHLFSLRYLGAVLPHTWSAVLSLVSPRAPGVDFTLGDMGNLFTGTPSVEYATTLQRGTAAEFFANTLGKGDLGQWRDTINTLAKRRVGANVVVPEMDAIFSPELQAHLRGPSVKWWQLPNNAHCFLQGGTDAASQEVVRRIYRQIWSGK